MIMQKNDSFLISNVLLIFVIRQFLHLLTAYLNLHRALCMLPQTMRLKLPTTHHHPGVCLHPPLPLYEMLGVL